MAPSPRKAASRRSRPAPSSKRQQTTAEAQVKRVLVAIARAWQWGPSRVLPPTCRYAPTCSAYAIEAVEKYGALKGGWLAAKRIMRCHPWGGHGHDPVP
ncbi:membrane protein insertion efficiency factor YidD [Altererythrobacter aurantiacus]|uniref:Putative membrane protein insertion efficiency factor n=1 Tax=Parapontixanthobacter aurantiacus TaxID=1463599 RepID=A0A844ZHG2_9SPHN|nr:membrane protein insertion efficiency factor YidD [Parapontixanthobacter aurantiacus]